MSTNDEKSSIKEVKTERELPVVTGCEKEDSWLLAGNTFYVYGLGNPGEQYVGTRHNVGFECVDNIRSVYDAEWNKNGLAKTLESRVCIKTKEVVLVQPHTFMNRSGDVVRFHLKNDETMTGLIVIHDDIDLPVGTVRISQGRGPGGHRGVASLQNALRSKPLCRIRVGVAKTDDEGLCRKPKTEEAVQHFVLSRFDKDDRSVIDSVIADTPAILDTLLFEGVVAAMNQYNGKIYI